MSAPFGLEVRLGFIGGSGLYDMDGMEKSGELDIVTPYGHPSDRLVIGKLNGVPIAFLPRHGKGHRFLPTEVNYRANVWAMKSIGVEKLVSISAVGSLREEIEPTHFLIPDGFVDRTRQRISTFFGEGVVGHVSMADPYCRSFSRVVADCCEKAEARVHRGGTYICIEGPQFSTRSESALYRSWGMDVIGMTNATESKLAREAGLCFATIALITDYDVWHVTDEVSVEAVVRNLGKNVAKVQKAVARVAEAEKVGNATGDETGAPGRCGCCGPARAAVMTDERFWPYETGRKLSIILD